MNLIKPFLGNTRPVQKSFLDNRPLLKCSALHYLYIVFFTEHVLFYYWTLYKLCSNRAGLTYLKVITGHRPVVLCTVLCIYVEPVKGPRPSAIFCILSLYLGLSLWLGHLLAVKYFFCTLFFHVSVLPSLTVNKPVDEWAIFLQSHYCWEALKLSMERPCTSLGRNHHVFVGQKKCL